MKLDPLRYNKNGCSLGIYCYECSGKTLKMDGHDKGNMIIDSAPTYKTWRYYKCLHCGYRCSYDEAYVRRNAIR